MYNSLTRNFFLLSFFSFFIGSCHLNSDQLNNKSPHNNNSHKDITRQIKSSEIYKKKSKVDLLLEETKNNFKKKTLPLFSNRFPNNNIEQTKLSLDRKTPGIEGGSYPGNIDITIETLKLEPLFLKFAIFHEMGHIVTIPQKNLYNLGPLLNGEKYNDYQKSEFLADLIATHLMSNQDHVNLINKKNSLEKLLGPGDAMHPSGRERVNVIMNYLASTKNERKTIKEKKFKKLFSDLWNK